MRLTLAFMSVVLLIPMPATAADTERVGWLVEVPDDPAKNVEAAVGDILRFDIGYAVIPDKIVLDLKLEIKGKDSPTSPPFTCRTVRRTGKWSSGR